MTVHFNERGLALKEEIKNMAPKPVLFVGDTGWGKSLLARMVCADMNKHYVSTNAYPGMDIGLWVGMWRPNGVPGGVELIWEDGVLTAAVKRGSAFFLEELTRAPQDATARIFGLMDGDFRYWSLPEAGIEEVAVHPDFWMIATANPTSNDYYTYNLDKALQSRFTAVYNINEPIADEEKVIADIIDDENIAKRLLRVVADSRKDKTRQSWINTRDLVLCAELIAKGIDPLTAIARAVSPKYGEKGEGILNLAKEHFKTAVIETATSPIT